MMDPSIEWMIDKDNPPEDNLPDVTMTSPTDTDQVRFVLSPETNQPPNTNTHSENDDMMMKTAIKDDCYHDLSLMGWTTDNDDPPNDKENSPESRKPSISISYAKIQKVDDLITNDDSSTPPSTSTPPPPSPPLKSSTKSVRKIREKRRKRSKRKARDLRTKHLEQQVEDLQRQLNEKQKQRGCRKSEILQVTTNNN